MAEITPLCLRSDERSEGLGAGQLPGGSRERGRRIDLGHVLEAASNDFRKGPLFRGSHLFGALEQLVGDLDLSFYHDGKMP